MTDLPAVSAVELELQNGWLTIWFNQPENRNALSEALVTDLVKALLAVRDDRSIRGITLRGKDRIFCAGGDLKAFSSGQSANITERQVYENSVATAGIFDLVNSMPQVVVAVVEGAAMAGGFGIACCADVVIVKDDAQFALSETAIGLTPAQISPFVIQRLGYTTARRLMLTATRFTGSEAVELGFADHCVTKVAEIEKTEFGIRRQILRCAPGAVASIKELILKLPTLDRQGGIEAAASGFAKQFLSAEAKEGVASFIEKRKPNWSVEP